MKCTMIYTLTLKDGRRMSVIANNRVEAFDKMEMLYPMETAGHSFKEITSHYAGKAAR